MRTLRIAVLTGLFMISFGSIVWSQVPAGAADDDKTAANDECPDTSMLKGNAKKLAEKKCDLALAKIDKEKTDLRAAAKAADRKRETTDRIGTASKNKSVTTLTEQNEYDGSGRLIGQEMSPQMAKHREKMRKEDRIENVEVAEAKSLCGKRHWGDGSYCVIINGVPGWSSNLPSNGNFLPNGNLVPSVNIAGPNVARQDGRNVAQ